MVPRVLPAEGDGVQLPLGHEQVLQARGATGPRSDTVHAQPPEGLLLRRRGEVGVGRGDGELRPRGRRAAAQRFAVEPRTGTAPGEGHAAGRRCVRPRGEQLPLVGQGDEGRETRVAVDELPGAVDGIDDPHRRAPVQGVEDPGVGGDGLLADHLGPGQQRAQLMGQVLLGQPVGDRHQVLRAALLAHLVPGELPEAGHDLGVGRAAHRFVHGRRELGPVLHVQVSGHGPHRTTPL